MRFKLFLISYLFCIAGFAQNYKVVHISGDIYSTIKLRNIKTGDIITGDEKLNAKSSSLNCILFSGVKKLVYNQKSAIQEGSVNDLFASMPERQLIGSRSEGDSSYIKLSDYFTEPDYLFIGETEKIRLNNITSTSSDNFKFVAVDKNNNKSAIEFIDNILTFKRSDLFLENEYEKNITIYKVNTATGEFIKEVELTIARVKTEKIIAEVDAILSMEEQSRTSNEKKATVYTFLNEIYGGLNQDLFNHFMALNYAI